MFCLDLVAGWKQIKNKSCSENGTIVFCLVLKINKISKISRGWEVSCILRMKYQRKRTKCFCFRNNCVRKRQKMKITVFVWQMSSHLQITVKKTEETVYFFWVQWLQQDLKFLFICLLIDFLPKWNRQFLNNKTEHFHGNAKTSELSSFLEMLN